MAIVRVPDFPGALMLTIGGPAEIEKSGCIFTVNGGDVEAA